MRLAHLSTIALILCVGLAARAQEPADDGRVRLVYRGRTLLADSISREGSGDVHAVGHVGLTLPAGSLTAGRMDGNLQTNSGVVSEVVGTLYPYRALSGLAPQDDRKRDIRVTFVADTATYSPTAIGMTRACLTTCTHAHPHYRLTLRDATFAGQRVVADGGALYVGGLRIGTLPRVDTTLGGVAGQAVRPTLVPGSSGMDGLFAQGGLHIDFPGLSATKFTATARAGTKGVWRGEASLEHTFDVTRGARGTLALVASRHADMGERVVGVDPVSGATLARLVVNREPAIIAQTEPIPLNRRGYTMRMGASAGRYTELPVNQTHERVMSWGALATPSWKIGYGMAARAEFGLQAAIYDTHNRHAVGIMHVAAESDPANPDRYLQVAYLRRTERGHSPFAFDRTQIRQEIFTEAEFPLTRRGDWRLDVWNRHDLDANRSRALNATLIYRLDCISYGVSYNNVNKSLGVGFIINGFDTFRHGVDPITFAP